MTKIVIPVCAFCGEENNYPNDDHFIRPEYSYKWSASSQAVEIADEKVHKDAHGDILNDDDIVTLIEDLKFKDSSLVNECGTKIKNIRLVDKDHEINFKVDNQSMLLKSEYMRGD